MGQKVHPHGFRVGIIKNWDSRWFVKDQVFGDTLVEDYNLRKYLKKALYAAGVAKIEKEHEERYLKLLANVNDGSVFKRNEKSVWMCRNCGHIHDGAEAPEKCPVCDHPKAYFQLRVINY